MSNSSQVGTNNNNKMADKLEFDEVLERHVGQFGHYQKLVFFFVALEHIFLCLHAFSPTFTLATPYHKCSLPVLDPGPGRNCSEDDLREYFSPKDKTVDNGWNYSQCKLYNRTANFDANSKEQCALVYDTNDTNKKDEEGVNCTSWDYDKSDFPHTIVTEWDLVCHRSKMAASVAGLFLSGRIVGLLVFGHLADRIGRKPTLLLALLLTVTSGVACAFMPTFTSYVALRFVVGACASGKSNTAFVLTQELVGPAWRAFHGSVYMALWGVGYLVLTGMAYFIRDWRQLHICIAVPEAIIFLVAICLVPESPRWLMVHNREKQARCVINRLARCNGKKLPDDLKLRIVEESCYCTLWDILKTPALRLLTLNLFFNWFANSFVYYGLDLFSSRVGGSHWVHPLVDASLEIPAYLMLMWALVAFGRLWPYGISMVIGSLCLMAAASCPPDGMVIIVFSMIGKFFVLSSYAMAMVYAGEIYPTSVRALSVAMCTLCARLASICAVYVHLLKILSRALPLVIFGLLSLGAGLVVFLLPETKGLRLIQTVAAGEAFITDNSVAKCTKCCERRGNWDRPSVPPQQTKDETLDPMMAPTECEQTV